MNNLDMDAILSDLEVYAGLGTPDQIKELISKYEEAISELEEYRLFGTVDEVKSLFKMYRDRKSRDSSGEISEELRTYRELGTPEQIKELIERYSEIKVSECVTKLSDQYNVSPSMVSKIYNSVGSIDKTKTLLVDISGEVVHKETSGSKVESARLVVNKPDSDVSRYKKLLDSNI